MRKTTSLFGSLAVGICMLATANAQDAEQTLARVADAYNVEALDRAETIRLRSDYRLPFKSHDYSFDFHDLAHQRFHIVLDVNGQRGSHEFVTEIAGTSYHGRHLVKDDAETFISYGPDTYTESVEAEFLTRFGGTFRSSDVLIAYWLTRAEQSVRYVSDATWLGYQHDIVEVDYPGSPPLRVFVRQRDGAITKMERQVSENQHVFYTFRNHQKDEGVLLAREHSLFVGGNNLYFAFNRRLILDDPADSAAFELDPDLQPEPERTDQSEMEVRAVGASADEENAVHQVCQGEGCTAFMRVGGDIVGYGMSSGFADRLAAYRAHTGSELLLRYVIAADHHDEDIGGAGEATDQGATLLVTDQTARKLQTSGAQHKLEIVSEAREIGDVTLFSISTDHAVSTLVAYNEPRGLILQSGHYYSSFVDRPSYARRTAVSLFEAMPERTKNQANAILSGQDLKAESWSDFVAAVEAHEAIRCHGNRRICQGI